VVDGDLTTQPKQDRQAMPVRSLLWLDASFRGIKVMAQYSKNLKLPQIIYTPFD
jgi:hypothetical protein